MAGLSIPKPAQSMISAVASWWRTRSAALAISVALVAVVAVLPASASGATSAAAPISAEPLPGGLHRLSGPDRYSTAIAAASRFDPGVDIAFVATGADYPDALAGGAAAAQVQAPLLLTPRTILPPGVVTELRRLRPDRIAVLGGSGVVSGAVVRQLEGIAPVERISGDDRYATGRAIVQATFTEASHAIIATGRGFADALGGAGVAGRLAAPVLLVDGARTRLPEETVRLLEELGVESVSIVGGTGAVSAGIEEDLAERSIAVTRHGGSTRYETNALLNSAMFPPGSSDEAFLATGANFPDALAGAALAGGRGAPLFITAYRCVPSPVHAAISALGASIRTVLGGTGVVSATAAANVPCELAFLDDDTWATTGWELSTQAPAPYSDRPPVDVRDPAQRIDATGLRIYQRRDTGQRADHPVVYAQYGISALMEYERTGNPVWLNRAIRNADRLVQIRTEREGAWWYPYPFSWSYIDRTLSAPWWSAMGQGQALSLFVRLADATGQAKWQTAADRTWQTFTQAWSEKEPWARVIIDGHLYLEEYAGDVAPLLVLNGQIFAIFGLYDYWAATGSPDAARVLDGAATTVLEMMPRVRNPGDVSFYCGHADYCRQPYWQNRKYHEIHSWQLATLGTITDDERFDEWADLLRSDWAPTLRMRSLPEPNEVVDPPQ